MATTLSRDESLRRNRDTLERLLSEPTKVGAILDEPVRQKIREKSFSAKIAPPTALDPSEMTYDFGNVLAAIVEVEPDIPGAIQTQLGAAVGEQQFNGLKAKLTLSRFQTPVFKQDTELLKIHRYDILDVITALLVLQIEAQKDSAFIAMHQTACGGSAGVALGIAEGAANWRDYAQALTPTLFVDSTLTMESNPSSMPVSTVLMNNVSRKQIHKILASSVATPDLASEVARNGMTMDDWHGVRVLGTIKRGLVTNGMHYHYGDPERTIVHKYNTDTTVKVKADSPWVEVSAWETSGMMTPVPNALTINQFST